MQCRNRVPITLGSFIRSLINVEPAFAFQRHRFHDAQSTRFISSIRTPWNADRVSTKPPKTLAPEDIEDSFAAPIATENERPSWQLQKAALKEKLGGEAWSPRKKLSPDTMQGIRHLHQSQPDKFTTPVLADHFKVSPEAIRRILKSKWQPSDEEHEARMQRWDKRGERIWSNLVEMGVKPPKRWRDMGVGRAQNGERPRWKSRSRNMVDVRDSVREEVADYFPNDDIIPTVGGKGESRPRPSVPLSERL